MNAASAPVLRVNIDTFHAAMARKGIFGNSQLSARLGISLATVKRVMNGHQLPSNKFLASACIELGAPLDVLTVVDRE